MKINIKLILSILLVITWLLIIFTFSNMDTNKSNGKSKNIIYSVVKIFDQNEKEAKTIANKLNLPLRKGMHMFEYFVLSILLLTLIKNIKNIKNKYILVLLMCFLYSLTDEFHQLFITGRTGQFKDCIIDTIGAIIGLLVYNKIKRIKEKNE